MRRSVVEVMLESDSPFETFSGPASPVRLNFVYFCTETNTLLDTV